MFKKGNLVIKSLSMKRFYSSIIKTGGELIYDKLVQNKVTDAFIFSGGSVMPIIDALYKSKINYYVNSHEQNCGHAATGYAKSSGKTGVCLVTSGPGITNMITPMLDATNDSTPLVVISGQVPKHAVGSNAFQEAPAVELSKNVCKWSYQVNNLDEIGAVIDYAFYIANHNKPGAVHIDVPKCVSSSSIDIKQLIPYYNIENLDRGNIIAHTNCMSDFNEYINFNFNNEKKSRKKINYNIINYVLNQEEYLNKFNIDKVVAKINKSKKPIFYIGQGCKDAYIKLRQVAIYAGIPVTSTIHGKGIFDDHHELSLEWCGMHGHAAANYALQEADCIIALGSRFDDRTTGLISEYAPIARKNNAIIHVNIEESEFNKVIKSDFNIHNNCGNFLDSIKYNVFSRNECDRDEWINKIKSMKTEFDFLMKRSDIDSTNLHMEEVLDKLYQETKDKNVIFTTGVGNHQMQAYQFIKSQYPNKILSSGSLGVMGSGLPYAVGSQIANKDKMIIAIDGDSSFNMTMSDLKTIKEHNLPIKIAIMNNNSQMMVTIWEKLYFNERYTATINKENPDYTKIADAFGIKSIKCDNISELDDKIKEFIEYKGSILCEFNIKKDICLPLVGPGKALDDMVLPGTVTFDTIKIEGGEVPG
jgi:acetolactate synthase I/II/III large subunit